MTFRAKLRRGLPVWTAWRHRHAAMGVVAGVTFHWVPGDDYATGNLAAEEVTRLHGNANVLLECFGAEIEIDTVAEIDTEAEPLAVPRSNTTLHLSDRPQRGTPEWRKYESERVRAWRARRAEKERQSL